MGAFGRDGMSSERAAAEQDRDRFEQMTKNAIKVDQKQQEERSREAMPEQAMAKWMAAQQAQQIAIVAQQVAVTVAAQQAQQAATAAQQAAVTAGHLQQQAQQAAAQAQQA